MRDYPETESAIRDEFEALSDDLRNRKVKIAITTASTAYSGFTIGGPVGAAVGAGLGLLISYWGYKSYRQQVYDQYEAAGMVSRPRRRIRSIFNLHLQDPGDPGFFRYPHGQLVGDVVLEVMAKNYPGMSQAEITKSAFDMVKTFDQFRRDNPDTPIEVAAEVILFMNGIMRNTDTGIYETFDLDALFQEPPPPVEPEIPVEKPSGQMETKTLVWLLAGAVVLAVILERSR